MKMPLRSCSGALCLVLLLLVAGCIQIKSFLPPGGPPGTEVIVRGEGFSTDLDGNQVTLAGQVAQVLSATSTELLIKVPTGISRGKIKVRTSWLNGGESVYEFIPMPSNLEYRRFKSESLSETAGRDIIRPFWIMYPPSFDVAGARFPIVYALHGYNGKRNTMRTEMGEVWDDLGLSTLANYDENSWLFAADMPGLYFPIIAYTLMECLSLDEFVGKIGPRLREVAGTPDINRIPEIVQAIKAYMPQDPPNWLETLQDMIIVMPAADNSWYSNRLGPPERRNPQGIGQESIFPRNAGENPANRLDMFVTGWHEKYIMNDLPGEIKNLIGEEKLAPLPKRQFILGGSMGGFGAMKCALRDPGSFAAAAELSGPLDMRINGVLLYLFNRYAPEFIDIFGSAPLGKDASLMQVYNQILLNADSLAANNPLYLAERMSMNTDNDAPDFFLEIGENDILEIPFSGTKQATLDIMALLQSKGIHAEGGIIPGAEDNGRGGHHPDFWRTRFSHVLKFFSEAYDRR